MMSLLTFTIFAIIGVVTSQNPDVNSQSPYRGMTKQESVEAATPFPPASSKVENRGIEYQLVRLEVLLVEKLENLKTEVRDISTRLQSLEYQSSEVHSSVNNIKDDLGPISQYCSSPATPVLQNNENLEAKVENLEKDIQVLMNTTKILSSNVETVKQNVSSLLNVTRSMVDSSSNLVSNKVFNESLQQLKDLQAANVTSLSLNCTLDKQYPRNCREVSESGNHMIQPEHAPKPFEALCDLETRGGGWMVIQRRLDGSQDFYLGWEEYKKGFGHFGGEFWLGLENIHLLTGFEANELLIELADFELQNKSAFYSEFSVGSEIEGYSLKVLSAYSGDAGDSLAYHAGMKFTTKDNEQDKHPTLQCAHYHRGAWWYNACTHSNLNGEYFDRASVNCNANYWYHFKNSCTNLKHTRMLVRPKVESNNN